MTGATVTMLNSMAGRDFEAALDRHVAWGVSVLDLKDAIFGKGVTDLTLDEAGRAAEWIAARGLSVYCLSTGFFGGTVEAGEAAFRERYLDRLDYLIAVATLLRPKRIRLLSAQTERRAELTDSIAYLCAAQPWVIPLYREAIDRLHDAGFRVTIENEVGRCILSNPQEILDFFAAFGRHERVCFTWDVQNLWQMGTFPTLTVYDQLKPLIGYYHLKGGQHDGTNRALRWRSALEDASWPVVEITRQVVADGVSPVICLNPSHGEAKPGYDYRNIVERDLAFIRQAVPGLM